MAILARTEAYSHNVIISDRRTESAGVHELIPADHRLITLEEVSHMYMHEDSFRAYLSENNRVWIGKIGVESDGFHEIHDDLSFSKIDRDAYLALPMQFRSYHTRGPGRIAVAVYDNGYGYNSLSIDGSLGSTSYKARAMYVKDNGACRRHAIEALRR